MNIHASLLPRWRGAAPIQRAILAGDAETGITIMQMDAGLDTGPVLLERRRPIGLRHGRRLHDALAELGAAALLEALDGLAAGTLLPRAQPAEGVTYAAKIEKAEARIDWNADAAQSTGRSGPSIPGRWPRPACRRAACGCCARALPMHGARAADARHGAGARRRRPARGLRRGRAARCASCSAPATAGIGARFRQRRCARRH